MKHSRAWVIAIVLLALGGGVAFVYRFAQAWLHEPIAALTQQTIYEVPQGESVYAVLHGLQKRGLMDYPRGLSLWLKYTRSKFTLKAGEYELRPGMTPFDVVELLSSGRVVLHSLKILEGATFADFQRALSSNDAIRVTLHLDPQTLLKRLGATVTHPEGEFFPDTYDFPKGTSDIEMYTLAYRRMQIELDRAWSERDRGLPLANAYEALILASIIEKESGLGSERPMIAGVFVERLRKGMRLQTDPTVIYGMGNAYDGNIRKVDLLHDTPYNTYTRPGLPPTPICLPSLDSLRAAVHPKVTGALYFVATGNGDGGHYFSKTLEEHNAAWRRYMQNLRK